MKPTVSYSLFDDAVEVYAFGKSEKPMTADEVRFTVSENLRSRTILRPDTSEFNARVCEPADLTEINGQDGIAVYSGYQADGVTILPGQTAWFQTADCPIIIARHDETGEVIAAHTGRWSLIHNPLGIRAPPRRHYASGVD